MTDTSKSFARETLDQIRTKLADTTTAAVERANGAYVHHSDYAALSAQLEAARAEGKAEGLRDAAGIADKSMRKYALAAYQNDDGRMQNAARTYCADGIRAEILAIIPADTPAPAKVTLQEAAKVLHLALTEASPLDALIQAAMDRAAFTDGTSEWVFNFRAALRAIAGGRDE